MKNRFQITAQRLAYLFGGTILIGSLISGWLNSDKRWMEWHFSRLGEGGTFSSFVFNFTLIIAACLMYFLGRAITKDISRVFSLPDGVLKRSKRVIGWSFYLVTVCLAVIAVFPFDKNQVIHNIFGYSMLFVFLYMCIFVSRILPIFSSRFYYFGFGIIATTVACYILFLAFKIVTLLEVETVLFSLLYVWLLLFIKGIEFRSTQIPAQA